MRTYMSAQWGQVEIHEHFYNNGATAIQLRNEADGDITTLSINLPDYSSQLKFDEFFAKTWDENAEIAREALHSGQFVDTRRSVTTNIGSVPIWRCR